MSYSKHTWETGETITATKLNNLEDGLEDAYVKPVSGIPKTDLAQALQTSIGLADTALQPVLEITVSTAGAVTQALDPGKIYHFTGAVSSLSLTLNAAASGQLAQYHFDFESGSTAATVTLTGVTWAGGSFVPEASKRYECDILNGYGVYLSW